MDGVSVAKACQFAESLGHIRKKNTPRCQSVDWKVLLVERVLTVDVLILRRRPKVIAEKENQVVENAFSQRASGRQCGVIAATDKGASRLLEELVVVGDDRHRLGLDIYKVLHLPLELHLAEL